MKEIDPQDVGEVGGGFINCSMLPAPANFVCTGGVAGFGLAALLISLDANAGSTTNLSDVTAP
jgi:hypothetical protein